MLRRGCITYPAHCAKSSQKNTEQRVDLIENKQCRWYTIQYTFVVMAGETSVSSDLESSTIKYNDGFYCMRKNVFSTKHFLIVTSIMGITTLIIGIPLIIMAINTHLERDYLNTKLNNYITDTRFRQLLSLC